MARDTIEKIRARLMIDHPWSTRRDRGWQGCEMVNALCPSDLCQLPAGHLGVAENIHWVGTSVEPMQLHKRYIQMAPDIGVPHDEASLYALGWALDYKLNPKAFEQMFGQQMNIEEMVKWPV